MIRMNNAKRMITLGSMLAMTTFAAACSTTGGTTDPDDVDSAIDGKADDDTGGAKQSVTWRFHDNVEHSDDSGDLLIEGSISVKVIGSVLHPVVRFSTESGLPLQELEIVLRTPSFDDPDRLINRRYYTRLQLKEIDGVETLSVGNSYDPTVVINKRTPGAKDLFEETYDKETNIGQGWQIWGEGLGGKLDFVKTDGEWEAAEVWLRFFPELGNDWVISLEP